MSEHPKSLLHYRLTEEIGRGGMGVVWRALDTTLDRQVAIKILPEAFAQDVERLQRFQREAKLLASVQNHPNIAAIHGLHEAPGADPAAPPVRFLVLELVEGRTLAELLRGGPLALEEALGIARQITLALQAAHDAGVVHRDLKPANIKVTPDGRVKVLDFGIAKASRPDPGEGDDTQALTRPPSMTESGAVIGTPGYMSPERWRGKAVDKRADLWAFGCVLYEMLTGRPVFAGDTAQDTAAAVLTREPDWSVCPPEVPVPIRRLLRRCLEKDPDRRLHDIADARLEMDEALSAEPPDAAAAATAPRSSRLWQIAVLLLALLLVGAVTLPLLRSPGPSRSVEIRRLTDFVGLESFPAISPDGKSVAFTADVNGTRQIWVRLLEGGAPLQITEDPADHRSPRWAPNSSSILYFSPAGEGQTEGAIFEVSALGGTPRRLFGSESDADLSPDGKRVVYFRRGPEGSQLMQAARDGSAPKQLASVPWNLGDNSSPRWSPDGRWIAFQRIGGTVAFRGELMIVPAGGGELRGVWLDDNYLRGVSWLPDSSGLIFSSSRGHTIPYLPEHDLWTVALDGGEPRQLTFGEVSYTHPDVNAAGMLVAGRRRLKHDLWRIPVDGTPEENVRRAVPVTRQTGQVTTPSPGPGDRELVYLSDSGGHANIWVTGQDGAGPRQLTTEQSSSVLVGLPVWSPDGRYITFFLQDSRPGGRAGNWLMSPDGSRRRFLVPGGWSCWSWDSRWLYYVTLQEGSWAIEKVPIEGGEPVTVRTDNGWSPALHPDGETLFFVSGTSSGLEIHKARPENGPSELLVSLPTSSLPVDQGTLFQPTISPDGRRLALLLGDAGGADLWALPTEGGELQRLTDFGERPVFLARRVAWASDSASIFAAISEADEDVVLLEGLVD